MNTLKYLLFGLLLSVVAISCDDDDQPATVADGEVQLTFDGVYGDDPLVMNQVVDYNGSAMRINVSEFYLSEIQLNGIENGVSITEELSEVEYVKFTDLTGPASVTFDFDDVKGGEYSSLTFKVGVSAANNQKKPADFPTSNPLSMSANYWQGWQSYIFSKLEGKLDTLGTGSTDLTYIYHSGKDDLYTTVQIDFNTPIKVDGNQANINLSVDHEALFIDNGSYLDIAAKPTAHDANDLQYPTVIMGNFKDGITLE